VNYYILDEKFTLDSYDNVVSLLDTPIFDINTIVTPRTQTPLKGSLKGSQNGSIDDIFTKEEDTENIELLKGKKGE
jgi:hypothetical protein